MKDSQFNSELEEWVEDPHRGEWVSVNLYATYVIARAEDPFDEGFECFWFYNGERKKLVSDDISDNTLLSVVQVIAARHFCDLMKGKNAAGYSYLDELMSREEG